MARANLISTLFGYVTRKVWMKAHVLAIIHLKINRSFRIKNLPVSEVFWRATPLPVFLSR